MLAPGKSVELIYAGDRMAPALRHGQTLSVQAPSRGFLPGEMVVASQAGIPDVFRVELLEGDAVLLSADADPSLAVRLPPDMVLARVHAPARRTGRKRRELRRLAMDFREAWMGRIDAATLAAESIRVKYDVQAPYYVTSPGKEIESSLKERILREIPKGHRILVAGSGTGRECFALSREGYPVSGVDFSEEMIVRARRQAEQLGLSVTFEAADLRACRMAPGSLGGIVFTYEVYSFLPTAEERIELLRAMASWLEPGGRIFLSARRLRNFYEILLLSLQWLRGGMWRGGAWGDSHTRWIAPDGSMRRSFIHIFPERRLKQESRQAGLTMGEFQGGHCLLSPMESSSTRT